MFQWLGIDGQSMHLLMFVSKSNEYLWKETSLTHDEKVRMRRELANRGWICNTSYIELQNMLSQIHSSFIADFFERGAVLPLGPTDGQASSGPTPFIG